MLVSRLESRGTFRAASPVFGAWGGTEEFVRALPPWLGRQQAAEEPVPQVRRSPWIGAVSRWSDTIVPVPSTAPLARQAARPAGFQRGIARRSGLSAPSLDTASGFLARSATPEAAIPVVDGFARRAESSVGALGFGGSSWTGASVARAASRSARPTTAVSRAAALLPQASAPVARSASTFGGSGLSTRSSVPPTRACVMASAFSVTMTRQKMFL